MDPSGRNPLPVEFVPQPLPIPGAQTTDPIDVLTLKHGIEKPLTVATGLEVPKSPHPISQDLEIPLAPEAPASARSSP